MKLKLSAHPPFSLFAVVESHGWARLPPFEKEDHTGGLLRIERLDSGRVIKLRIREATGGVSVEADSALSAVEQNEVAGKVEWMLGLGQDFSDFYALAREEPKLASVVERARGRLLRSPTLFEDTVKTIATTNITWSGTIRMVEALVSQFGAPLPVDPTCHAFPTPERLAVADEETLRSKVKLGYRAPYVLELARSIASGDLDLEALKTANLPTDQLRKQLLALKGVGAYSMANLMMLLGRYGYIPVDSWALNLVSHEWYDGQAVGRAEVEAAFEGWGEWKGLAYWFWDWSYTSE